MKIENLVWVIFMILVGIFALIVWTGFVNSIPTGYCNPIDKMCGLCGQN